MTDFRITQFPRETVGHISTSNAAAHRLYSALISSWETAIIEAAYNLGIFSCVASGPATLFEIAKRTACNEECLRILVDALVAYGWLFTNAMPGSDPTYHLPEEYSDVLTAVEGVNDLTGKIYYDQEIAWQYWRNLAHTVKTGSVRNVNGISTATYRQLVLGIRFWAPPIAAAIGKALDKHHFLREDRLLVDIGCGSGIYSHLLLQQHHGLRAVGYDVPEIADIAHESAGKFGVSSRFRMVTGDFFESDWAAADLYLFANIFHLFDPEKCKILLSKARAGMSDDGRVLIVDAIRASGGSPVTSQEKFAALFAVSMVASGGGNTYSLNTFDSWLAELGLYRIDYLNTPMHGVIVAGWLPD
ncbi:methyltransferase [Mycolicibacterium baixiangningiae]|uniref:methyltransferase n=1 Tax=Mycolicibacterium baixiangningiae TaxID=2761578 RepID=UPI0018675D04|nr:methyltransferase [Mycolicibacterium baixiangningiae]